jgi:putative ABC transport system permease protein
MRRDRFLIVASISVGTALLASMLSSAYAVLIDPLPFPEANRIVTVSTVRGSAHFSSSTADYYDLSQSGGPLENSIYVKFFGGSTELEGHPESVDSVRFEGNLFSVFQKPPTVGEARDLDSREQGTTPTAILSYPAWVKFFASDPKVVGKVIRIGPNVFEVRAVLPPEYQLALPVDIWVGAQHQNGGRRDNRDGRIYARLPADVPTANAQAYLKAVGASLAMEAPQTNRGITFELAPLRDSVAGESKLLLQLLTLGAAIVLCVAYFNAYQLLAAKAGAVSMRWSICMALGASRTRLFQDMLKEPLLLNVIGCGVGLILSILSMHTLRVLSPTDIPRIGDTRLVWQVGLTTLVFSVVAAVLFTLLMLLRTLSFEGKSALHGGSGSGSSIHHAFHARKQSVLIAQIALSSTLLISIGMVATALSKATNSSLGFDPEGVSVTDLDLKQQTNTIAGAEYVRQVMRSVAGLPGVEAVASTSSTPFKRRSYTNTFIAPETGLTGKEVQYVAISPDFFQAMQARVLRGRTFTEADSSTTAKVAILNQGAEQALFGNRDSLNQSMQSGAGATAAKIEVIGLVENMRQDPATVIAPPIVYLPLSQSTMFSVSMVVRARVPMVSSELKSRIWAVNANQTVEETTQLNDVIEASFRRIRYMAFLMTLFAGVTMLLSALGIYASVAQWVSTSQREIALHLALGATYTRIRSSILTRIMTITGMGLAIGAAAALGARTTMKSLLYGVQPQVSAILTVAVLLLGMVAFFSSYIPALRSRFIDPAELLRSE